VDVTRPTFAVTVDGQDITQRIGDRLLSLTILDSAGLQADTVEIELDDRDAAIALPPSGAVLDVSLGYDGANVPMGRFVASEIELWGPPSTMTIRAEAAHLGGELKSEKTRAWDGMTIGEIVATIAADHGLEAMTPEPLASFRYEQLDQQDESDVQFLGRMAEDHDALATVKARTLLFMRRGENRSASGVPIPPVVIRRDGPIEYRVLRSARTVYGSVEARWRDRAAGADKVERAGKGEPVKRLRQTFPNAEEAKAAAAAKLEEGQRTAETITVLVTGNPLIGAEGVIEAVGFRPGMDGTWSITSVEHSLTGGGYQTTIEGEPPNARAGHEAD
jgi:phage protein D